ncbi:hypothetical protein BDV96DRAFT_655571 [Lophiotrema nucula]|uniref:Uncharacterized protein n=1 Tax=Lophiotrema nucula TaxID=690887 RepID=A0A6A5YF12_9PLEO|nr:hypothetical protein BDV96DRAFT_655571 [Lophiotrema nucula]
MANYNGTSTAWNANPGEGMDKPQPVIWSFSSTGEFLPIEFSYSKGHKVELGGKERAFVAGFKRLLDEKNLTDMFGLCEYPGESLLQQVLYPELENAPFAIDHGDLAPLDITVDSEYNVTVSSIGDLLRRFQSN